MYKVLIAEDDPMVAMINEQYIRRNKQFCVVGKCKDGKSALEFLEQNDVDLLILDVFMPYADGFETLRQIRKKHPLAPAGCMPAEGMQGVKLSAAERLTLRRCRGLPWNGRWRG